MSNSRLVYFFSGAMVALIASLVTHSVDAKGAASTAKAAKSGSHVNLSPEDYIEILQLQSEYPRDVDPGAVRDASWMFTRDARSVINDDPMVKPEDFQYFYGELVSANGQAKRGGVR